MGDLETRLHAAFAGRYEIQRELGRGGMALVFLARDLKHHRAVAIKVLRPELAAALGPDRFLREIEIAAQLTHPHIVPLYDSGESGGFLYYVMPYVAGESLRDRLHREKQLGLNDALQITREVADALSYAHGLGVVHRDIKPENILFEAGHAVVSDFGIARAISAAGGDRLTETGLALGTPVYMSPEQAAGERELDARSDLYSLACVLYEMLAGQPPFTGPTPESVVRQHLAAEPPRVTGIRGAVPAGVDAAIRRALAKTPADRFPTVLQFAETLTATGPVPRPLTAGPALRRWGVGAIAVALAAVGAFVLALRGSPVIPSASVIAVLPFAPSVPDTALSRLGRDLVFTLSANLDGVGGIRTVDAHSLLVQSSGPGTAYSLEEGLAVGRRFGAGSVVHGSLVRVGRDVRVDAGLLATDDAAVIGRVTLAAPADSIAPLTDSLTWALLRHVWRRGEPPSPSLDGALRTRSVPALRAFLEGERAIVEGRWTAAADAFHRAMEADSAFWLAYVRYAYTRGWEAAPVESAVTAAYRRHRFELPDRERLVVEASLEASRDSLSASFLVSETLTARFPNYWFGWMDYADGLVHFGPLVGYTSADARRAFERTLELHPRLVPAWTHLTWMCAALADTACTARAVTMLERLDPGGASFETLAFLQMLSAVGRDTGARSQAMVEAFAREAARDPHPVWRRPWSRALVAFGYPAQQIVFSRTVIGAAPDAQVVAAHRRAIALAWAARGAWDSALVALQDYVRAAPGGGARADAYGLTVLGAWVGAMEPPPARAMRPPPARDARLDPTRRGEVAWLDGILATVEADRRGVAAARARVRRSGDSLATLLDRSLAAFELHLSGDGRGAAESLAALEWERAERSEQGADDHPYLTTVNRLAASAWLLDSGDTAQAARLLTWHERVWPGPEVGGTISALAYLERARIEKERGRAGPAADYYRQFLRRYDLPVPAHRDLVDEAREALARERPRR